MDFLGVSKAAALGWARGPGKRSERRSRLKAICPNAMRSFWKVAASRLTDSIRIQSGRRALRCFQNELHHFIILNLKWYEMPQLPFRAILRVVKSDDNLKRSPNKLWFPRSVPLDPALPSPNVISCRSSLLSNRRS